MAPAPPTSDASPGRGPFRLRWLVVLLAVGVLVPLVVFGGALVSRVTAESRALEERRFLDRARTLADALDRELSASLRALHALAQSERIELGDLEGFHREAARLVGAQPSWEGVRLLAPDGRVLVDTSAPSGAPLEAAMERDSLERAIARREPLVGDLAAGRHVWAFPIRVPIVRNGAVRYVLTAVVTAESVAALVRTGGDDEWTRSVIDSRGRVVARTRSPERFVGEPASELIRARSGAERMGIFRDTTLDGVAAYVAHAPAALSGWSVAVLVPTEVVDAPARRSLVLVAGLGALIVLCSAAAAFWAAARLSRSLEATVAGADALAAGAPPRLRRSRVREVALLHAALERTAALLQTHERERDEHVARAEAARADAETASRAKDEFLAMLGHELRNPLSPIVTALELLRMRGQPITREHEIVERQVRHLVRLVDDLLDVSRITRGTLHLRKEPVELASVVARAVEMATPLLESREHALAVDVPPNGLVVFGDPDRLAQVVANLLTNAARYTPARGHVRVAAAGRAGEVSLWVTDDGKGISPELLPRVFEPFVQGARSSDRREGGLGIGLMLVRSLVFAHGGTVEGKSEGPGKGSTFTVTLPRATAGERRAVAPAAARRTPPPPRTMRVLVVDDNVDAAALLAELLGGAGHEVAVAHDGPGALDVLGRFTADVAILDLGLPVMDGHELALRIRERFGAAAPVLFALTGYGQGRDRARSEAAGFDRHFVKPADVEALLTAISALGATRARGDPRAAS